MVRIINDMENTVARLSSSSSQHMMENNLNTLISEDDLKYVLDLLQSPPITKPHVTVSAHDDKATVELQHKLEETCGKLESMCLHMEQVTCSKLREEKESLNNQLNDKKNELEFLTGKISQHESYIKDLKRKTEEQSKIICALKETNTRASALNKILNEQLEDTEKKYQELVTEMQFLMLEKEKNIVLMKCKDQDLIEMRKNLEEIKTLVIEHLTSINIQSSESSSKLPKENKPEFDNLTTVSALSLSILQNKVENDTPKVEHSQALDDSDSWSKLNNPIVASVVSVPDKKVSTSKTMDIKASIKNILEEMKHHSQIPKNLSAQNLMNLDDPAGISNWSDLDLSDDEIRSGGGYRISDTDTNY